MLNQAQIDPGIHTFSYNKTNYFLIEGKDGVLLAFDAGWPTTWIEYARGFKQTRLSLGALRFAVVSHFHLDHAGLFGEMLHQGISCAVFDHQVPAIGQMESVIMAKEQNYRTIDQAKLLRLDLSQSCQWLRGLGIAGQFVATLGHSADSISYVSDSGIALTGDLAPPDQAMPDDQLTFDSWASLRALGAMLAYPAHGRPLQLA